VLWASHIPLCFFYSSFALGIGTLGNCPSDGNSKANLEYQAISKCSTNVPTQQPGCAHLDENCLQTELMTPVVAVNRLLSRITIGWAEDLGYQVDYNAADPFGSNLLGSAAGCNCNRRELSDNTERPRHVRRPDLDDTWSEHRRELSDEGYNNAVASGIAYLDEVAAKNMEAGRDYETEELKYVGDKLVWVYYVENNNVHSVLVQK
jgi:hypothetical protein